MAFIAKKLISASGATEEPDDDFNLVTGLYHFDGSNGAQNNTFVDSSSNSFSVTRRGNASQGTFSPFSSDEGKWSVNFPVGETTTKLTLSSSSDFAFGTSAFTIDAWVYVTADTNPYSRVWHVGPLWNDNNAIGLVVNDTASSDKTAFCVYAAGGRTCVSTNVTPKNEWFHVACVRDSSGNFKLFINGNLDATNTSYTSTNISPSGNQTFAIGNIVETNAVLEAEACFEGFISNLRVVNGTALYSSNFTPSTSPLTDVTNTKLLTCCSNRFRDKSTSAHTITTGNLPRIQPFSPFAPSAAYDSAVNGGSGYFDGSGDYLRLPTSSDFDFSGSFTIEAWLYLDDVSVSRTVLGTCANITNRGGLYFGTSGTNFILFQYITNTTLLSAPITRYQWNHVAVVRHGVSIYLYINGTSAGSVTYSQSFSGDSANGGVGGFYSNPGVYYYDGYMSDLRVVNGTAMYTSNFTPPTAPLTAVTNTKLLLNFTNGQMIDSTAKNNFETVGSALLKQGTKKFGISSCDLYGSTGSRVASPPSPLYNILNAGKFTVEFWIYVDSYHASYSDIVGVFNGVSAGWLIYQNGTNIEAYINGVQLQVARPSTSTWTHIALTRDGTTTRLFKDGTSGATSTSSLGADQTAYGLVFGGDATGRNGIDGFIDEFRLTLGKARYTSNFTVPTQAFANL